MRKFSTIAHSALRGGRAAALLLAMMAAGATACHRRPLEDPSYGVRVKIVVDTDSIRNVTSDIYNPNIELQTIDPDMMHVMFFDATEDKLVAETYLTDVEQDDKGHKVLCGDIGLAPGVYRMYSYSFGADYSPLSNIYDWGKAYAGTIELPESLSAKYRTKLSPEEEAITYTPDHLMVAREPQETIPYHMGTYTVWADAPSVVESFYLQIKVQGLEYVSSARAVLSGMSSGNFIALGQRVDDPTVTHYFSLEKSKDGDDDVICTIFNSYGRPSGSYNSLSVTFDLVTGDGRGITKTIDISDLFLSRNCIDHNWLLIEDSIVVPPPPKGNFAPSVEDWESEEIDIPL